MYEPILASMRLGEDQISNQDLSELEASLGRINEAIANPASLGGPLKLKVTSEAGVVIARGAAEAHIEVGPLSILFERKQSILDRIALLRPQQQLDDLQDVVRDKVTDPALADDLLAAFEQERIKQQAKTDQLSREAEQVKRAEAESQERLKIEIQERRSRIYRSFLHRESVATIVGALLLISLTIALVVAMFTGLEVSQIVSSAFLIILGYFFGQSTSRDRGLAGKSDDALSIE
ncbi:hypothetical protein [Catellatospora sp. TT07R-123]|uniref:hypothetical protein n=1 Tax=Catellatospora sp. TT07R-123 TaxID=2733863 RepID=UPI001BB45FDF|nr:hypothetical protein [Catellatospora sp. TT07R-123]